mmetsp:Transcript_2567/g.3764  ORF Transcript_2567/g.3764 Transcript_2567/m.3764 type:complete len:108 (+) Transcript_2567:46-369(+)
MSNKFEFLTNIYKTLFSRNSMWVGGILVGAIIGERVGGGTIDLFWNAVNSGKQWDDILPAVEARWQQRLDEEAEYDDDDDWDDDDEDWDDDDDEDYDDDDDDDDDDE